MLENSDIYIWIIAIAVSILYISKLIVQYLINKRKNMPMYAIGQDQIQGGRKKQEDSYIAIKSDDGILGVLADGMGGLADGKLASSIAVDTFVNGFLKNYEMKAIQNFLRNTSYIANANILEAAEYKKMGTTLVSVIIKNEKLYWVSIGDSYLYLYRNKEITRLNKVHTYENRLKAKYREGLISREELFKHPKKNQLTSYLGNENFYELDYNINAFALKPKDKLIVCSDGVYNTLSENELEDIIKDNIKSNQLTQIILEEVQSKNIKNQDNASLIIIEKNN